MISSSWLSVSSSAVVSWSARRKRVSELCSATSVGKALFFRCGRLRSRRSSMYSRTVVCSRSARSRVRFSASVRRSRRGRRRTDLSIAMSSAPYRAGGEGPSPSASVRRAAVCVYSGEGAAVKETTADSGPNAMRILLLADIHGNWPALQAVAAQRRDLCLCLGDLVDYGPEPTPCVEWVRKNAAHCVRGNHDHGVAQRVRVNGRSGFKYLTGVTRELSWQRLGGSEMRWLANLPVTRTVTLDNMRFLLVHATPRDPLDEYAPADPDLWARRLQNVEADVICVGHTHLPYVLEVGDKLVINPGSVGQPRDGDPRASYALIENYKVEMKRR